MTDENQTPDTPEEELASETVTDAPDASTPTQEVPEPSEADEARAEFDLPAEWSDSQVENWVANSLPEKGITNADGLFLYDPTRAAKSLSMWSTSELLAFLKGELQHVAAGKTAAIVKEYARREDLEPAWADIEVLAFFRDGVIPAKTENGVWINDVTRGKRQVGDWTLDELAAWAHGYIPAVGAATDTLLAKELHVRAKLGGYDDSVETVRARFIEQQAKPAPVVESVTVAAAKVPAATPAPEYKAVGALTAMNVSMIDVTLERYIDTVAPGKPVTDTTGGAAQRQLENLFQYVLRLEGQALVDGLNRIKVAIDKHRAGVFSPSNAYRFVHQLKGDRKAQQRHVNFIELFLVVTDKNQARRRQIDVRQLLVGTPAPKAELLVDYFTNRA